MPYERFIKRLNLIGAKNSVLIVGKRRDIIQYAMNQEVPAIIVTGIDSETILT